MGDTLRRVAEYQGVAVQYEPGYGDHSFRITMEDGGRTMSDVFWIDTDRDLNAACNTLMKRLVALGPIENLHG
jgi:hypothetical protein